MMAEDVWSEEKFETALIERFVALKAAGRDVVLPSDFLGITVEAGLSRSTIYPVLRRWTSEKGWLIETDRGFVVVRG